MNKKLSLTKLLDKLIYYDTNNGTDSWGDPETYIRLCDMKYCLGDVMRYCYENNAKIYIIRYFDKRSGIRAIKFITNRRKITIERLQDLYITFESLDLGYYDYDRNYRSFTIKSPESSPWLTIPKLFKQLPKDFSDEIKCWLLLNEVPV